MFALLVLLLIVLPILELYVLVQAAQAIGTLWAIGLMLCISFLGAFLIRLEGFAIVNRIRKRLFAGEIPSKEIADGGLAMLGACFLLTPGFLTDGFGLALLFPPTRAIARGVVMRQAAVRTADMKGSFGRRYGINLGGSAGAGATGADGFRSGGRGPTGFGPGRPSAQNRPQDDVLDVEEVTLIRDDVDDSRSIDRQ